MYRADIAVLGRSHIFLTLKRNILDIGVILKKNSKHNQKNKKLNLAF
jgi:hypothetical protein